MSKRIGEALVSEGVVTPKQLEQALRTQLIFGGHLGTSFLELGFVREERLGEALASLHGVPYAGRDQLDDVPEAILGQIPRKLAERYRVVPYRQERRTLWIAAIHPRDLQAIDEIAFVTGFKVAVAVAPEIRILEALERYYGIPRPTRLISICRDLDARDAHPCGDGDGDRDGHEADRPAATDTPAAVDPQVAGEDPSGHPPVPEIVPLSETGSTEVEKIDLGQPDPVRIGGDEPDLSVQIGGNASLDDYGYGRPWHEVAEEQFDKEDAEGRREPAGTVHVGSEESDRDERGMPLDRVIQSLAVADNREDLARAILGLGSHADLPRILFRVRGTVAEIWDARGLDLSRSDESVSLPVAGGSIFELLLGREAYLGPVPSGPEFAEFYTALGRGVPERIFLMPAYLDSRLAAVLYLELGSDDAREVDPNAYRTVLDALGLALELVLLKRRIRSMAGPAAPMDARAV